MLKSFLKQSLKQLLPASYWQERSLRLWYAEQQKHVHSVSRQIQRLQRVVDPLATQLGYTAPGS